jgi:hypothetical protein
VDVTSLIGIGGICIWAFCRSTKKAEPIPVRDPNIVLSINYSEYFKMSQTELSKSTRLLSFTGIVVALLAFVMILFVADLPSGSTPVDQAVNEARQAKADEARVASLAKLTGYEVINADAGIVRIPIEDAMNATVAAYKNN